MFKTRIPSPDSVEDDLESPFFPDKKNSEMIKWKLIASNLFFGKKNIYTLLPVLSIINYINRLIEHCIWMFAFGWAIYVYNITYSLPPIHLPAKIILSTKELDDKNRLQIVWLGIQTVTQYDQNYSVTHPQLQHNLILSLSLSRILTESKTYSTKKE